ncbi:MAG TPA: ATP-binding protein [Bacteroidota bacterium]|nr:ATP-binding protein [Bacteroidota bacterium]
MSLLKQRRSGFSVMDDLTLAQKMTVPFTIFIAGISLFISIYLPIQYEHQAERAMIEKTESIVSITSFGVGPAFMFGDTTALHETIENLRKDPQISFVVFIDADHRIAASYELDKAHAAGYQIASRQNVMSEDGRYYIAYKEVRSAHQLVGELYIGMSLSQLHNDSSHARFFVALASALFFVIGVLFVIGLSTLITKPLAHMVETAEAITAGDLTVRTHTESNDEVGHLAEAFNMMVDRLHSANIELELNNQGLEQRVIERTSDLEREVSVRKQSEAALRESELFLHNSQKVAHLGSYIYDVETGHWKSSQILDAILGIDEGYVRNVKGMADIIHPDFRKLFIRTFYSAVQTQHRLDLKYMIVRQSDGAECWVHGLGEFEVDSSGRRRILGTIQDITESITLERQLLQAQKLEGLGTLAGGIAHDFNNLLSMILGSAELLRLHVRDNAKIQKHVDRIIDASERGASISRQLLIFSRPEQSELKPVSVNNIIVELQQMLSHFLPKSISIEVKTETNEAMVMGDAGQIHQALLNLVLNAGDAMSNNGKLTIGLQMIEASALPRKFSPPDAAVYAVVTVADTGEGMSESMLKKIFDPFFTTKAQGKGTGLGLAMVHGIVKHHKGLIDVQSTPGKGTTFTLYFPGATTITGLTSAMESAAPGRQRGTILFVDDEHMIREMLTEYLQECGYQVITARNGIEGLEKFTAERSSIDLVITDLGMPEMGGEEFFKRLQTIDPSKPVLISSGYLDGISRENFLKMGAIDVLTKPFRFEQIRAIIQAALARTALQKIEN